MFLAKLSFCAGFRHKRNIISFFLCQISNCCLLLCTFTSFDGVKLALVALVFLKEISSVFLIGLKIITTLLGGGGGADGIDKVDNGNASPMQVCFNSIRIDEEKKNYGFE